MCLVHGGINYLHIHHQLHFILVSFERNRKHKYSKINFCFFKFVDAALAAPSLVFSPFTLFSFIRQCTLNTE